MSHPLTAAAAHAPSARSAQLVSLYASNCSFAGNAASLGGGGAVSFDGGLGLLTLASCSFSQNSALRSGAVEVVSSGPVAMDNAVLVGNTATAGDGGGVGYASAPASEICESVSGAVTPLTAPMGDLAPAALGHTFVVATAIQCGWRISSPPWVPCHVELSITMLAAVGGANNYGLAVTDVATGALRFSSDGVAATGGLALPPPMRASGTQGLLVWFNVSQGTTYPFQNGFAGSWRTVCDSLGGAPYYSDQTVLTLANLSAVGNRAAGNGGAVAMSVAAGNTQV